MKMISTLHIYKSNHIWRDNFVLTDHTLQAESLILHHMFHYTSPYHQVFKISVQTTEQLEANWW